MGMKELRHRAGKRAEEIAVELGVSVSTVRNWDQQVTAPRMTPFDMERLTIVYDCSFKELVSAEEEMYENI